MGLWPFGRAKADVESSSRVVVLRARDGVPMRAKITVRLEEPQTQAVADAAAEQCGDLVRLVVREAPSARAVLGLEAAIATEVVARVPKDGAPIRGVEIAGLHIVGDPGHVAKPLGAHAESPAWLHAAPSSPVPSGEDRISSLPVDRPTPIHRVPSGEDRISSLPRERPTPIQSVPASRPPSSATPAVHAPVGPAPRVSLAKVPAHVRSSAQPHAPHAFAPGPPGQAAVRPPEPFASTAVSPSPFAPPPRPSEPSRPAPTPHTGIPVIRARPPSGTMAAVGGARPPSGTMAAVGARPPSGTMGAVDEPSSPSRRFEGLSPPSAKAPLSAGPGSRGSSRPPPAAVAARRRVVAARLPLPTGAGPYEVARGLTPLFRDTAGRILVAFLRTYDLTVVRRVPFDAVESDILSSLTAPSDGAPGTYAACHAAEIQRWRDAFGIATLEKLLREANLAAAALAFEGLSAEGVAQREANAVVEGLAGAAFGDPDMIIDVGRYLFPAHETMAAEALASMIDIAGEGMPPGLELALEPLFASLREEVAAAALLAKEVMTGA